jgi:uncharacterized protein YbaR (Trm112 family)
MVDKELFELLVCPQDKNKVLYNEQKDSLKCQKCGSVYLVKEGIPVML